MSTPKRGTAYYNLLTEEDVWLYRITNDGSYLVCNDQKFPLGGKYYHADKCDLKIKFKTRTPIKPKSDKLTKDERVYSTLRKVYLDNHPHCLAKTKGCTIHATEVHHKAGRGKNLLNIKTWLPVCHTCHHWIELHPVEAKIKGFSTNRL